MKTDTSTKSGYAYMLVKERILDGTYLPGQRLVIDQIAKEVGSSHIPVREAIRKLEADQYIEYRAHAGAVVTGIDAEVYEETLQLLSILEGFATAEASTYLGENELRTLHTLNDKMQTALECYDLTTFGKLNKSFHFAIYDHCPNELLVAHITSAWEKLDTVRTSAFTTLPMRHPIH
ncbi:transcriptional regulator, GntR family [Geomicrobium sp. JCM 19039]|nr:transcriptional regulator, GntR family [Geomicrobium sp. JCM 19039]